VNGSTSSASATGDDTVEFELTPEQLLLLSQAAEEAEAVAPAPLPAVIGPRLTSPAFSSPQPLFAAAAILAYVVFAWWSASRFALPPQPPVVAVAKPAVIPRPALPATSAQPAVRLVNPFDASEVFEFPAGTSLAESQEKVAQILLQRARDRRGQWEHVKPAVSVRTASLYRSP
jgi:hypothetical protein